MGFEGQRQQRVACQNRHGLAEFLVAGRLSASQIVVVQGGQIVVNQRVGVNELECAGYGQNGSGVARKDSKGLDAQDRPKPFAAGKHAVAHGLVNYGRSFVLRREQTLQFGIDEAAVFFKKVGKFHPWVRSGLLFALGLEWLGRHFAACLFQKDLDSRFGLFQLLLAIPGELHAFLE